jgi:hypothetical protein
MSKPPSRLRGKRPKEAKPTAPPTPPVSQWKKVRGTFALLGTALGILAAVAGLIGFFFSSVARLNFQQFISMEPGDPFHDQFVLVNKGFVGAHDVKYTCWAPFSFRPQFGGGVGSFEQGVPHLAADEVGAGQPLTVQCSEDVRASIEHIWFGITFHYRPSFTFWNVTERFRFEGEKAPDGTIRWIPQPALPNWPPKNP